MKRATEYALISMSYISGKGDASPTTAREISTRFGLPFELTAKTLQKLKSKGMIRSIQGVQGGYILDRPLSEIALGKFLHLMEGNAGLVKCCQADSLPSHGNCQLLERCGIRSFMTRLNQRVFSFLSTITLDEMAIGFHDPQFIKPLSVTQQSGENHVS